MRRLKISRVILCEGKYDKIKLSSIVDGEIITLEGFGIFKNEEKRHLIRTLAEKRGLIVLTDSDSAGSLLRGHINNITGASGVVHLYTPAVSGKEKRKSVPSKEGILGVEGTDAQTLYDLLLPFENESFERKEEISRLRFFEDGFMGGEGASKRRARLIEKMALPKTLSAKALLSAINILMSLDEYERIIKEI